MGVAVRADAVGGVEMTLLVTGEGIGLLPVVEADDVRRTEILGGTNLDPSFGIGFGISRMEALVQALFSLRKFPFDVVGGVFHLVKHGWNDLAPGMKKAPVGRRHIVLDDFMETREGVVRNEREHVVFHMVIHVPVKIPVEEVHVNGPAVEPVVEDVFCKTCVLGQAVDGHEPGAEDVGQSDKEKGQDAARSDRKRDNRGVNEQADAGLAVDLGELCLGDVGFFISAHTPRGMHEELLEIFRIDREIEESHDHSRDVGGARDGYFRIASHDARVAVMTGVAPAPEGRFAHHHEGGDLVERIVHPVRLEGGSVA